MSEMVRNHLPAAAQTLDAYAGVLDAAAAGADDATIARCAQRLDDARAAFDPALCGDLAALLDDTLHGVHQIADLVGSLKDYSRIDQARSENVDLHGLIESALRIGGHLLRRREVVVRRQFGELPAVTCAPAQINQVLLNLIGNAAQAIEHDRGVIAIRTHDVRRLRADRGAGQRQGHTGGRVAAHLRTVLHDQAGRAGHGSGPVDQPADRAGARRRIAATSTPGSGTRFVVALPIAGTHRSTRMSKPCLLLVDDEERILRSLAMLFRGRYDVIATTDGVEALQHVRSRPVHVVVSDQRMPAISGVDLLRQIARPLAAHDAHSADRLRRSRGGRGARSTTAKFSASWKNPGTR